MILRCGTLTFARISPQTFELLVHRESRGRIIWPQNFDLLWLTPIRFGLLMYSSQQVLVDENAKSIAILNILV